VILFLSPILEWLIAKYAGKYSGRQITTDWVSVNPLTGVINISNLKIYENGSDSVFFSSTICARVSLVKLFIGTYEIKSLILNHPRGKIIQKDKDFNFNDLIDKFSSKGNSAQPKKLVLIS